MNELKRFYEEQIAWYKGQVEWYKGQVTWCKVFSPEEVENMKKGVARMQYRVRKYEKKLLVEFG